MTRAALANDPDDASRPMRTERRRVVVASSLGTVFEWYDFYLYGSLAEIIARQFFSGVGPVAGFMLALLAVAAGFVVRPIGALVFGRIGDLVGRKYAFLITILLMGLATFLVGLLPSYQTIGIAAPLILVGLRLVQGLALGGEYGGAATYVAEYAPRNQRGLYTGAIQTTATLGLLLSLLVILGTQTYVNATFPDVLTGVTLANGEPERLRAFDAWGWRIPFLGSALLLLISVWIRLQLQESPAFQRMKAEGTGSKAPLAEAFGRWANLRVALLALFGSTAGQAVVWYTGQFYALFFLIQALKVETRTAYLLIAAALALGTPGFVLFGWLSDKVGRKPIILGGCLLAALTYMPIFKAITHHANPRLMAARDAAPVTVIADPADCSVQFIPGELRSFVTLTRSCDLARGALAGRTIPYRIEAAPPGTVAQIRIGPTLIPSFSGAALPENELGSRNQALVEAVTAALTRAGYLSRAAGDSINKPAVIALLTVLVLYVAMVYGPIAAQLAELFPTRIRYSGLSLPYHIGNGWFGGVLPTTAFAMMGATGDIYFGLWYPIAVASMTVIIGAFLMPETKGRDILTYEGAMPPRGKAERLAG